MCAGNTPQEAMVHGLNEILERYVVGRLFEEDRDCPTIPLQTAARDPETVTLIQALFETGHRIIIKDCSLGGSYPVLGTFILRPESGRFRACWGSDPSFAIALQRCVTETFQASVDLDVSSEKVDQFLGESTEPLGRVYLGRTHLPATNWLRTTSQGGCPDCFGDNLIDNRSALRYQVDLLAKNGFKVYVRDASVFGFPAFFVYVPGMSETYPLSQDYVEHLSERKAIRQVLLRLDQASPSEIESCAQKIATALKIPHLRAMPGLLMDSVLRIVLDESCDFSGLQLPEVFLTLLFNRIGDYQRAFRSLDTAIKQEVLDYDAVGKDYYLCALTFFRLKADAVGDQLVQMNLVDLFGGELAEAVLEDLLKPENSFQYVTPPKCGDCSECPVADACYYDKWKSVDDAFAARMSAAPIDQQRLAEVL
jgi:ribosomal protein S12 methylthiotransferase accessory factor